MEEYGSVKMLRNAVDRNFQDFQVSLLNAHRIRQNSKPFQWQTSGCTSMFGLFWHLGGILMYFGCIPVLLKQKYSRFVHVWYWTTSALQGEHLRSGKSLLSPIFLHFRGLSATSVTCGISLFHRTLM